MAGKPDSDPLLHAAALRKKAESLYRDARSGDKGPASLKEARSRLQELEIQKIEWELRNQELQASQEWLGGVLDTIADGFAHHDRDLRFTYVNHKAEQILGKTRQELLGKTLWECCPELLGTDYETQIRRAMAEGAPIYVDRYHTHADRWIETHAYPSSDGLAVYYRDITAQQAEQERLRRDSAVDRAQAELSTLLVAPATSIDEMVRAVLDCSRRLTESEHGFVGFVDATGDVVILARTDVTGREGSIPEAGMAFRRGPDGRYPTMWGEALNTGEAFYTNSPQASSRWTGVPEGHVALTSFLTVPVIVAGELMGQIAVANSCRPYTDKDLEVVQRLATFCTLALQRLRADEAARLAHDELEQRVKQRTLQLRELASELTLAEQRERSRLAELLHDRLQQSLVAARMKLEVLRQVAVGQQFKQAFVQLDDLLDRSIAESRSLASELSPPILNQGGLAAALVWLGRYMKEIHGLTVKVDAPSALIPMQESLRVFFYQVARELLFNVIKHARTDRATVQIGRSADGHVMLTVSDRGVGFDPALQQGDERTVGGLGMSAIRRRLDLLGGHMEVDSSPGKGTRITIQSPPTIEGGD